MGIGKSNCQNSFITNVTQLEFVVWNKLLIWSTKLVEQLSNGILTNCWMLKLMYDRKGLDCSQFERYLLSLGIVIKLLYIR